MCIWGLVVILGGIYIRIIKNFRMTRVVQVLGIQAVRQLIAPIKMANKGNVFNKLVFNFPAPVADIN